LSQIFFDIIFVEDFLYNKLASYEKGCG